MNSYDKNYKNKKIQTLTKVYQTHKNVPSIKFQNISYLMKIFNSVDVQNCSQFYVFFETLSKIETLMFIKKMLFKLYYTETEFRFNRFSNLMFYRFF